MCFVVESFVVVSLNFVCLAGISFHGYTSFSSEVNGISLSYRLLCNFQLLLLIVLYYHPQQRWVIQFSMPFSLLFFCFLCALFHALFLYWLSTFYFCVSFLLLHSTTDISHSLFGTRRFGIKNYFCKSILKNGIYITLFCKNVFSIKGMIVKNGFLVNVMIIVNVTFQIVLKLITILTVTTTTTFY